MLRLLQGPDLTVPFSGLTLSAKTIVDAFVDLPRVWSVWIDDSTPLEFTSPARHGNRSGIAGDAERNRQGLADFKRNREQRFQPELLIIGQLGAFLLSRDRSSGTSSFVRLNHQRTDRIAIVVGADLDRH